jgi:hypothetical protein
MSELVTKRPMEQAGPLGGRAYRVSGRDVGADYAASLLESLGAGVARSADGPGSDPAIEWARSGAMALTGLADAPPRLAPGPLASCARGALEALRLVAGPRWSADLDGPALLGERAAVSGFGRAGTTSPGGSCRLLRAADRWIALNLARDDDLALLPAWLGEGEVGEPWTFVAERVARRAAAEVVERARLLGLPAAVAVDPDPVAPPWLRVAARGPRAERPRDRAPLVVDLSSLWAGPLCAHLLGLAGARVVKVESTRRPDGARFGPPVFFDLLNGGKASVALDFATASGRARLRRLVDRADIVVEGSRPRALAQLGIDAEAQVRTAPGLTWVSLTGYGRGDPEGGWVAFGDDAGVAAGLAVATSADGSTPLFCGDAIPDPLTGIHAALAALASWEGGGGRLIELALRDVAAHALGFGPAPAGAEVRGAGREWEVVVGSERAAVADPRARRARAVARPLGADTEVTLRELGVAC